MPSRLKPKPDSRPPLEHPTKGMLLDGKWIKNPEPPAKGIWRLRSYVENLEFRPGNLKLFKYGKGTRSKIEKVENLVHILCYFYNNSVL